MREMEDGWKRGWVKGLKGKKRLSFERVECRRIAFEKI